MINNKKIPQLRFRGFTDLWETKTLGEIAEYKKGGTIGKSDITRTGMPCILYGELYTKYTELIFQVYSCTNKKVNTLSKKYDVIIPTSGETANDIALSTSCILLDNIILGGDLMILTPNKSIVNGIFLTYMIRFIYKNISDLAQGSSVVHLYWSNLQNIQIPITTTQEQEKIGNFFQKLDTLIELRQKESIKLKNIKKAMLSKLFPQNGSLTPQLRFRGFTDDWETVIAKSILDIRDGTHDSPRLLTDGVIFITSKNIVNGVIDFSNVSYISIEDAEEINKRSKVENNDIIFSMIGTIGEVAIVETKINFCIKNVGLFKHNSSVIQPRYLLYYFKNSEFKKSTLKLLGGGIQQFLSLSVLRNLQLPLPLLKEQEKIGNFFQKLDTLIELRQQELIKLKNIKKAYLDKMFI